MTRTISSSTMFAHPVRPSAIAVMVLTDAEMETYTSEVARIDAATAARKAAAKAEAKRLEREERKLELISDHAARLADLNTEVEFGDDAILFVGRKGDDDDLNEDDLVINENDPLSEKRRKRAAKRERDKKAAEKILRASAQVVDGDEELQEINKKTVIEVAQYHLRKEQVGAAATAEDFEKSVLVWISNRSGRTTERQDPSARRGELKPRKKSKRCCTRTKRSKPSTSHRGIPHSKSSRTFSCLLASWSGLLRRCNGGVRVPTCAARFAAGRSGRKDRNGNILTNPRTGDGGSTDTVQNEGQRVRGGRFKISKDFVSKKKPGSRQPKATETVFDGMVRDFEPHESDTKQYRDAYFEIKHGTTS